MLFMPTVKPLARFMALAVCSGAFTLMSALTVSAQWLPESTYPHSCTDIEIDTADTLRARCLQINGSLNRTSIQILGIENVNGQLRYGRDLSQRSNYPDSCRRISVVGATLMARCQRTNGSSTDTWILIRGIENQNGSLGYQYGF